MARAGRKRKGNVVRVNGRVSQRKADVQHQREETEMEATAVARRARERIWGIDPGQTTDPRAGSVVGRLAKLHAISRAQERAAYRFEDMHRAYRSAISAPKPLQAADHGAVRGRSAGGDHDAFARRAIAQYQAAIGAVQNENCILAHRGSNLGAALYYLVIEDRDFPHMHCDLRLALNALQHHFGYADEDVDERTAAA